VATTTGRPLRTPQHRAEQSIGTDFHPRRLHSPLLNFSFSSSSFTYMASAQLSIELLEHIVDELAKDSDKPSLRACARASSILHSRARHYLFSTIRLESFPPARASALVELLDADMALGTCVTSLIVSAIRTDWSTRLQPWLYGCGPIGLRMLLPRFTHLTTAEFISLDFRQMPTAALAAALPISLERLAFSNIEFAVDEDVVALLTAVPHLRSVAFYHCICQPAMVPERTRQQLNSRSLRPSLARGRPTLDDPGLPLSPRAGLSYSL
jgi:hypothetical protein